MYRNSQAWHKADEKEKKRLKDENLVLGLQLSTWGVKASSKNGVWYDDKGQPLFERFKKYIFHDGGIIGDKPTKKQNELFIKAEKGEAVLTEKQQSGLYKLIDAQETLLAKYGAIFSSASNSNIAESKVNMQIRHDSEQAQNLIERGGDNIKIEVPVQIYPVQKLDNSEIRSLTDKISTYTISELDNVFALRGKRSFRV